MLIMLAAIVAGTFVPVAVTKIAVGAVTAIVAKLMDFMPELRDLVAHLVQQADHLIRPVTLATRSRLVFAPRTVVRDIRVKAAPRAVARSSVVWFAPVAGSVVLRSTSIGMVPPVGFALVGPAPIRSAVAVARAVWPARLQIGNFRVVVGQFTVGIGCCGNRVAIVIARRCAVVSAGRGGAPDEHESQTCGNDES
ncbi:MAG: hypothetical protein HY290_03040 [Planctomycetia bacterium]|nr:hypothetical protein [Planctomycetia bacterium]